MPGDVLQMSTNKDLELEELGPMEDYMFQMCKALMLAMFYVG